MLPHSLLERLGVEPLAQRRLVLADGRDVEYSLGFARISLEGEELPCPVIFGPEDQYILGATTLEIFSLLVDPLGEMLIPRVYRGRPF